jgi:DNA-binding NarL/FixJ family response regulator
MKEKICILVADDQELTRKSLIALLNNSQDFDVVHEAENGKEVIEYLKQNKVDIVLMDVDMPVMNAKTALEIIRVRFPLIKVIIQGIHHPTNLSVEFMLQGACNYLDKSCTVRSLYKTIRTVHTEGYFLNERASHDMMQYLKNKVEKEEDEKFNERETVVMIKICEGFTNKEIADDLKLAVSTIDFHRTKIYRKTKCNNATELLRYAIKKGIVSL